MSLNRPQYLLKKYRQGTLDPQELAEWRSLLTNADQRAQLEAFLDTEWDKLPEMAEHMDEDRQERILKDILTKSQHVVPKSNSRRWFTLAASIALFLGGFFYFIVQRREYRKSDITTNEAIIPVNNGVTLTLSDGKKITLDKAGRGLLRVADGTRLSHTGPNVDYSNVQADTDLEAMHTLANNSGAKFDLTLADGSVVYLDVASTITYPVAFSGSKRQVSVNGQAYFKVKHNAKQPFEVRTKDEVIEDLGTEFNVNAYRPDGCVTTTLIEGAIALKHGTASTGVTLNPGQQAVFNGNSFSVVIADMEIATAWMQGKFIFDHESLENILTEVSRIYAVDFVWVDNALKTKKFGGAVSRTKKLANILNFLRKTGEVDFHVSGRRVSVFKPDNK